MREDRGTVIEWQPEVFAPPPHVGDRPAGERSDEVQRTGDMAADRARVKDLDGSDRSADRPGREALADRLDFR